MKLRLYMRECHGEATEVYPTLDEALAGFEADAWRCEMTNERDECVEWLTGTGDDEVRVTERDADVGIAPPGKVGRDTLEALVDDAVGSDAREWAELRGIEPTELFEWLRWLASNEFRADASGRIGFGFQVGVEVGMLRLAEGLGLDAEPSSWWAGLSTRDKLVHMELARDAASLQGTNARKQLAAIKVDVDAAVGAKVNRLYALDDAIYMLRKGEIGHDEFCALVDQAPPSDPKP